MKRSWIGLALLGVVIIGSLAFSWLGGLDGLTRSTPKRQAPVSVAIFYGGEKSRLLRNPTVRRVIEEDYRITLDARKAGSIEMAVEPTPEGVQCLWPSNEVAAELARETGKPVVSDANIFNSPIVFYAWADVAEALERVGVVSRRTDGFLGADLGKLVALIERKASWREDLGLEIYGPVKMFSTHPAKSNSGNIWSAMLATAFNGGAAPSEADLPSVLPKVKAYFDAMGYMEDSSGDIFENFLKQGMGARPMIVGYENQLIEFLIENAQAADLIREKIRVLYPAPTIYASHPLIALDGACDRLVEALSDPAVQDEAWVRHGFRTGLIGVQNDPADIEAADLPEQAGLVTQMPNAAVMRAIVEAVR